jgi:hypothetical protein
MAGIYFALATKCYFALMFLQYLNEYYDEVQMDVKGKKGSGVKLLKTRYRKKFRIPENTNYYSKEDLKKAEKKYVKLCLTTGNCR